MIYPLIRNTLFHFPPEDVHHFSMNVLQKICSIKAVKKSIQQIVEVRDASLEKNVFGLQFKNPVGLGAGFDKNAVYLNELEALGFGFVEIGTVTPKSQPGNELPRLFRLPKDKALINRMGFNNEGVAAVRTRLENWKSGSSDMIIGGNIGKNKITSNEDAWRDYDTCFKELFDVVDYFAVNVSSPNTPGLRELQEKSALKKILANLQEINYSKNKQKPLLLKIAPDLTQHQLDDIISLSVEIKLDGLIATNTTISRENLHTEYDALIKEAGGLSGKPLTERSTAIVTYLSKQLKHETAIIASGGIFTGDDALQKLQAGASLVQVWTGFIYEGPAIVHNICKALIK